MPKQRNDHASSSACARDVCSDRVRGRDARTHRVHSGGIGLVSIAAFAPSLLAACSGDVVSLGERQDEIAVPPHSRCQTSTTLEGPVRVESQEQLDALEGCEIIAGDLDIVAFPAASLRSLHALAHVEGSVKIGGHIPVRPDDDERPVEEWLQDDPAAYEASIVNWLPSLEGRCASGWEQLRRDDGSSNGFQLRAIGGCAALR